MTRADTATHLNAGLPIASAVHHISVCFCTYMRKHLLKRLLEGLVHQRTDGRFTFSIVAVDNDRERSAEALVGSFAAQTDIPIRYEVEPQQNIALARNRAVRAAGGDFIAFIDDDEFPSGDWLLTLYQALEKYEVDGALGPVKPFFEEKAPAWVVKGRFYERATYPTGYVIDGSKGRTGNVLLKRDIFKWLEQPFNPEFRAGEDQDFFTRMIAHGHRFIWCNEAVAHEVVPPVRWTRRFMLRRALLRGAMQTRTSGFGIPSILKSVIAVPLYAIALPGALLLGHHRFMSLLIRLCDHLGKLLALAGINPVRDAYVTG